MNRKDGWGALFAALFGVLATLGGHWMAGYQFERVAARQAQIDLGKQIASERNAELKALKQAGLRYMTATDTLVNSLVFASTRDKPFIEHLPHLQNAGNDVLLMADDELARETMALNQAVARLLIPNTKSMDQKLAELNELVVVWIKQFKRSLDSLKARNEEALSMQPTTQTAAQLRR